MDALKVDGTPHISEELLSSYLDGHLTPDEFFGVKGHLHVCGDCELVLEMLQETVTVLRQTEMVDVPRSFELKAVEKTMPKILFLSPAVFRIGLASAAAVLIFVIAGDLTGIIRTTSTEIPVQVGMTEPGILITPGSQPTPEQPLVTGGSLLTDKRLPSDNLVTPGSTLPAANDEFANVESQLEIAWWHIVLGLVSAAMLALATRKIPVPILTRRS